MCVLRHSTLDRVHLETHLSDMTIKQNKQSKYQSSEERLAKKDWSNRKQANKQRVLLEAKKKAFQYKDYLKEDENL